MIRWLVGTSLKLRIVVLALAVVLLVVGARQVSQTPVDVFPEFAPPLVEIQTEAPGLSSVEVERLVTVPLESALGGLPWLETMRSSSVPGLSSIVIFFAEGTDVIRARQLVVERIGEAAQGLPAVAKRPAIVPPVSSTSRTLMIGLTAKDPGLDAMELSTLTRWVIVPRLMSARGVANVSVWGERRRTIHVLVDPDELAANGVGLDTVMDAARRATTIGAGGFVETPNQRIAVTHVPAVRKAADLADVPVGLPGGGNVRLGDVARVVEGAPPPIGDAVVNGGPGLLLVVDKQPWANTVDVTAELDRAIAELAPAMDGVAVDTRIFRPATFIQRSVTNLTHATLIGCVLVILILGAFLWSWRTALISVLAIPLSLVAAGLVLDWRGGTINTMVLAGLVIALGEVVDDAIIDVENIVRRLRLEREAPNPRPALVVVLDASLEVRSAIVYATLIVLLVFLPVFLLPGLSGAFFRPLAMSYALAVLASMFVALVITPALALILLPRSRLEARDPPLVRLVKRGYRRALPGMIARPRLAIMLIAGLGALTAVGTTRMGQELMPEFKESDFLIHWIGKPGTGLPEMRRITTQASQDLLALPGVNHFGAHIGRAELGEEIVGTNFAELWISIDPDAPYEETVARIDAVVRGYPGLYRDVFTYLRERVEEVLSGAGAALVVRIFGPDLDVLREQALAVAGVMGKVKGVVDLKVEQQVLVPQLTVRVKQDAALQVGMNPGAILEAAGTLVHGTGVGEIHDEQVAVPVTVWGKESIRRDVEAVRRLPIQAPDGSRLPLSDLADVTLTSAPNVVQREGGSRRIDVTCDVRGRDLGAVAGDIKRAVRALTFPRGYHPELLGEYAERQAASRRLLWLAGLSVLGILLLLYGDFRSARLTVLVADTQPFALVGGVAATLLSGGVVSLGALVGFVTVLGIAARNGIMMVSHYRHLEEEEGVPFGRELVERGSEERLAPILMTALATSLALVPLVVAGNRPGHEIEHPLAVVILGGLVTSTLLNLFLLPALYLRFAKPYAKRRATSGS